MTYDERDCEEFDEIVRVLKNRKMSKFFRDSINGRTYLSHNDYIALWVAGRGGAVTEKQLSKALWNDKSQGRGVTTQTAYNRLRRLEAFGLLAKVDSPLVARCYRLTYDGETELLRGEWSSLDNPVVTLSATPHEDILLRCLTIASIVCGRVNAFERRDNLETSEWISFYHFLVLRSKFREFKNTMDCGMYAEKVTKLFPNGSEENRQERILYHGARGWAQATDPEDFRGRVLQNPWAVAGSDALLLEYYPQGVKGRADTHFIATYEFLYPAEDYTPNSWELIKFAAGELEELSFDSVFIAGNGVVLRGMNSNGVEGRYPPGYENEHRWNIYDIGR